MLSDLRFAFRQLLKSPGFTVVAILALALGVATATTMFTVYNSLLVRPVPFLADEASLLAIRTYNIREPAVDFDNSVPDFNDLRRSSQTLANALTTWNRTYILGTSDRPERALGSWITADGFQTLGVQPALGRRFRADEGRAGAPPVAILAHDLWKRSYGGHPDLIGQVVNLNNAPVTIVGVMPEGFAFPENSQIWQPFPDDQMSAAENRGARGWPTFARLKPGATREQAQVELDTLALRLEKEHPKTNTDLRFRALQVREYAVRDEKLRLQFMLGAVLAVLLISCGNVANLLLARAAGRTREIAVRAALGASRLRLVRQMLTESLLLGLCGGIAGLLLAFWQIDLVVGFIPHEVPFWVRFDIDWRVLTFALATTIGSSLFFGLFPALQLSHPDLAQELKEGGRCCTDSGHSRRLRNYLVVLQLALALVLLVVAGLMTRSFHHLQHTDPGIETQGVFTFRTGLPPTVEMDGKAAQRFFETVVQRLREIPGVELAGFMNYLPLSDATQYLTFAIEGRLETKPGQAPVVIVRTATPEVFPALRVPFRRGRLLEETDRGDRPPVVVISEAFARKFFPREDPLGRRLGFDNHQGGESRKWATIVGIVGDVVQHASAPQPEPEVWISSAQKPDHFMSAVLRVTGDPASYRQAAQDAVLAARPGIPIYAPMPLTQAASEALWSQRFFGGLFVGLAAVALFLAALGIYGVTAYSVSLRTQEIGVRMALGAEPGAVVRMVLKQGVLLVLCGLVLGFVVAWFTAQLLAGALHGIEPHDPPTFALVPLFLATVALAACYLPSRRATRIDPNIALRSE
jgi:putative ABC transport system permease protein